MKECIYCKQQKEKRSFSFEHVIPQCLGGAFAPDQFKTYEVCRQCNSNLGLFVDAAFEKNFLVSHFFREAAYSAFDPTKPMGLPLIPMGNSDLIPPAMIENEVCESWIGPLGEQIYWIRPDDCRLYWYVGGNPVTAKKTSSRAYFMFSERSHKNPMLSWLTFKDAFDGKKVKKIMCTIVDGANPHEIGFSDPDDLDKQRIRFFLENCSKGEMRQNSLKMFTQYDFRFMAKLGLGIAYSLFGKKVLETDYSNELYKALWHRPEAETPKIQGTTALGLSLDQTYINITGLANAVVILIQPSSDGIAVNLNLGCTMNWIVKCCSLENIDQTDLSKIENGLVIILYRFLQRGFSMTLPDFIAHKQGLKIHAGLEAACKSLGRHTDYFKNL